MPTTSRSAQRYLDLICHREEALAPRQYDQAAAEQLRQFRDDGRSFPARHANEWASALIDDPTFSNLARRQQAHLVQEAAEQLWEMQQRKLFELQCRWRAEKVTLPVDQVELSQDLRTWGSIERCPLVSCITAAEVNGYLAYRSSMIPFG